MVFLFRGDMAMRAVFGAAAIVLFAIAAGAHAADPTATYGDRIDEAISHGDFATAKATLLEAKGRGVSLSFPPPIEVIEGCLQAGKTAASPDERKAIAADRRNADNFAPDDDLSAAVALANGWGVPKDRHRAVALVCHASGLARFEFDDMVAFLLDPATGPFLFCEHITSGARSGQCESFAQDKLQAVRDRKLAKILAGFTPEQKAAFAALTKANEAYIDAHAWGEQDMSGTLRGAFYADEAGKLHAAFLSAIEGFEGGKRPPKDDFAAADKALNAAYRTAIANVAKNPDGTVTADGLRKTERLWLKLRDAWAAFGTARYSGTSADDWNAWATRVRLGILKDGFRSFE